MEKAWGRPIQGPAGRFKEVTGGVGGPKESGTERTLKRDTARWKLAEYEANASALPEKKAGAKRESIMKREEIRNPSWPPDKKTPLKYKGQSAVRCFKN